MAFSADTACRAAGPRPDPDGMGQGARDGLTEDDALSRLRSLR